MLKRGVGIGCCCLLGALALTSTAAANNDGNHHIDPSSPSQIRRRRRRLASATTTTTTTATFIDENETQWMIKTDSANTTRKRFNVTGLKWADIQQLHVTLETPPPQDVDDDRHTFVHYRQAPTEAYVFRNLQALGYDTELDDTAETCQIWQNREFKWQHDWYQNQVFDDLHAYRRELQTYYEAIRQFNLTTTTTTTTTTKEGDDKTVIRDVRRHMTRNEKDNTINKDICERLHLTRPGEVNDKSGLRRFLRTHKNSTATSSNNNNLQQTFFPQGQLSYMNNSYGWIEPLLPPLRHPNLCFHKRGDPENLDALTLSYLVHDFVRLCHALQPTSRIVLVDLGASPRFWEFASPVWELVALFEKFGFRFDHIYAFEKKASTQDTGSAGPVTTLQHYARNGDESVETVYRRVPRHLHHAYHWIHAAVTVEPGHALNPWTWIEQEFNEDDLVLVKLDIGPSNHEETLIREQLLQSPKLLKLVDHLYWEHKVHVHEVSRHWGGQMIGSVKDSLELFAELREKGVSAHYWV